jgi:hypothetical protein
MRLHHSTSAASSSPSSHRRRSTSKSRRDLSCSRRCKYCDRQHGGKKDNCPAYGQNCRKCRKANHFAKVCKSKQSHVCDIEAEELLTLGNDANVRAYRYLNVNNKSVYFMLDCGATVNLLPFTDASTVSPKLTALRPAEKRLTMYDGT